MPLLVVGTIGLDSVVTSHQSRDHVLGGAAAYFAYAASYFTSVRLVAAVGDDWPEEHTDLLGSRRIDTSGLQAIPGGKTFYWKGKYSDNMNERETLEMDLNVYADFQPDLPDDFRRCPFLFLANGSPTMQAKILEQTTGPRLAVADTMDIWIRHQYDDLVQFLKRIDGLVLNDHEARLLTGEENLVRAGHLVREMGPTFVVIKKGEHGAMFFSKHETYVLPAFPTEHVLDPTGAGDSFAGGMMGYLAEKDDFEPTTLKEAMAYGILVASFTVEDFSLDRLVQIDRDDIELRMEQYRKMLSF